MCASIFVNNYRHVDFLASEGLEKIVNKYDYNDLSKTKMNPKKAAAIRSARAAMEERE